MDNSPHKKSRHERNVEKNVGDGTVMLKTEKRASIPNESKWREFIS